MWYEFMLLLWYIFLKYVYLKIYKQKPENLGSWRKEGIIFVSIRIETWMLLFGAFKKNQTLVAIHTFTLRNVRQFLEAGVFTDQLLVHFETDQ